MPYEDNIVKQLLSEYEACLQDDTPVRMAPSTPSAPAFVAEKPAAASPGATQPWPSCMHVMHAPRLF